MKQSIRTKLENLSDRLEELNALLSDPEIINNQNKFRELSKEYAEIEPVVASFKKYTSNLNTIAAATEMQQDEDAEIRALAEEELQEAKAEQQRLEAELQLLLLPKDPDDNRNIFLEIRAGTGGDESTLFVNDLMRMYS